MLTISDALTANKAKAIAKLSTKVVITTIETLDSDEEIAAAAAILPDSPVGLSLTLKNMMIFQTMM